MSPRAGSPDRSAVPATARAAAQRAERESKARQLHEALKRAERELNEPEDVSDIIAEQERKRQRKADAQRDKR